jgi:hypothetical protein
MGVILASAGRGPRLNECLAWRWERRACLMPWQATRAIPGGRVKKVDFELKEVMDAVGPSAALAFAAWLFLQLLQQR